MLFFFLVCGASFLRALDQGQDVRVGFSGAVINQLSQVICSKTDALHEALDAVHALTTTTVIAQLSAVDENMSAIDTLITNSVISPLNDLEDRGPTLITSLPYNITQAGSYRVDTGYLSGTITILASNVTLDLGGNTIGGSHAINIQGQVNIIIRNGFLESGSMSINRTAGGLKSGKFLIENIVSTSPDRVISFADVDDMTIRGCVFRGGITLTNVNDVLIEDCVLDGFGEQGVIFNGVLNGVMRNCVLATDGATPVASIGSSSIGITWEQCSFWGGTTGILVNGSSSSIVLDHCTTTSVLGDGFYFDTVDKVVMNKCAAVQCDDDGFLGLRLTNAVVRECESIGNGGRGFFCATGVADVAFERCCAVGNSGDGFDLSFTAEGVSLRGCSAQANGGDGYQLGPDATNIMFHECQAEKNGAHGFNCALTNVSGHLVQECRSLYNTGNGFSDMVSPNATYVANFATGHTTEYTSGITNVAAAAGVTFWENVYV